MNRPITLLCFALVALASTPALTLAADPFVDEVVSFTQGDGGGFNADQLPGIVLGPPVGGGATMGSTHVVSLGSDGVITLGFSDGLVACDGPGPDFTVFENAFHSGSPSGPVFAEVGIVAVSQDGTTFFEYPYDPDTFAGLAGKTAVLSNPDNGIDPTDPSVSGGDPFDLADLGLPWIAYVRITDGGDAIDDPGNQIPGGTNAGFDLDAIAAVHACTPPATPPAGTASPTPTPTPTASATATAPPATCQAGALADPAQLKITHNADPAGDEALRFRGEWAIAPATGALDPAISGLTLTVLDVSGAPLFSFVLAPGPAWTVNGRRTTSRFEAPGGAGAITKAVVRIDDAAAPTRLSLVLKGADADFQIRQTELPPTLTVAFTNGGVADSCFARSFAAPEHGCSIGRRGRLRCE